MSSPPRYSQRVVSDDDHDDRNDIDSNNNEKGGSANGDAQDDQLHAHNERFHGAISLGNGKAACDLACWRSMFC